ncbi:MAG: hypothetical protein SFY96_08075 [Planctomycetota bacterium]|nr:hypothetical protein [Planctomycetota bacterium]
MLATLRTLTLVSLALLGSGCAEINARSTHGSPLIPLSTGDPCTRCSGYLLPGDIVSGGATTYRIDSDLPELFLSTGTLYSTAAVLPPMDTKNGEPVPEAMRRQRNAGFDTIDSDFDVFVYHMSAPGEMPRERRVVILVRNVGASSVAIEPKQIMESGGAMATDDGPESRLARRTIAEQWESIVPRLAIDAGDARVIGWTPRLSVPKERGGDDTSDSDFVTGMLRAGVRAADGKPRLEVSVVAIDGATPRTEFDRAAIEASTRGARSGEQSMDLRIPPPQCHVRRVVGVFQNFEWHSRPMVIDVSSLPRDPRPQSSPGLAFLMAAPQMQTLECPRASQTRERLLSPGYVHPETIGNYQIEYRVTLELVNPSTQPRRVDLRFGKQDADVGLAWQMIRSDAPATEIDLRTAPVRLAWAGAWRKDDLPDNTRSLLVNDDDRAARAAPITLEPGARTTISLRFVPVGTSSLPFHLCVVPMP